VGRHSRQQAGIQLVDLDQQAVRARELQLAAEAHLLDGLCDRGAGGAQPFLDLVERPYWIHPALTEVVQQALIDAL